MTKKALYLIVSSVILLAFSGCEKREIIFDHPFIYVTDSKDSGARSADIDSQGKYETDYAIILSSKTLSEDLVVEYDLEVGNGLTEGVDFTLSSAKTIVFPTGLYRNVIRINWLPRIVDPTKENWVKIVLRNNSLNFTMGFPGPDKNNLSFKINKINVL